MQQWQSDLHAIESLSVICTRGVHLKLRLGIHVSAF